MNPSVISATMNDGLHGPFLKKWKPFETSLGNVFEEAGKLGIERRKKRHLEWELKLDIRSSLVLPIWPREAWVYSCPPLHAFTGALC